MKRLLCNTLIIIIMMGVCFNGCFNFGGLSFFNRFSYAEADNWSSCDSSDLVTAFRYYCKSRNLAIEGSYADALTGFTTTTFNNICSTLGIDPTSLQAELKKTTQGNLGLRFLFSNTGITAYNRIFAEFLQNNDLSVGDEDVNKNVYSGKYFTDDDGNSCLIYITSGFTDNVSPSSSPIIAYGSTYKYSHSDLMSTYADGTTRTLIFNINNSSYTQVVSYAHIDKDSNVTANFDRALINDSSHRAYTVNRFVNYASINGSKGSREWQGDYCIIYNTSTDSLYIGTYCNITVRNGGYYGNGKNILPSEEGINIGIKLSEDVDEIPDSDVTVTSPIINNNTYNNNWTIIYNDGDTYISDGDDEPLPTTPPDGGGGDDPVNPDPDDPLAPYDPDKQFPDSPDNPTPDPGVHGSPGSDGTITIPDFNFDIPDINWSLDGLQHKFPFSLPFDLYNACKLLNAEPETPELDYTIDLVVYDWRVNYDLHWLDPAARVIRIFELLAFVVGLILITRRLIGG